MVAVPELQLATAPPLLLALLLVKSLRLMVSVAEPFRPLAMAPPKAAVSSVKVLRVTVRVP